MIIKCKQNMKVARCVCMITLMHMVCGNEAARILGIFPTAAHSHQITYRAIMKALAARGHHITVISPDPLENPVPNYTDIDLSFSYQHVMSELDFTDINSPFDLLAQGCIVHSKITDLQLSSLQVKKFINSTDHGSYDLVILETIIHHGYFGLIHHLGSPPIIGILALQSPLTETGLIGSVTNPAYVPHVFMPYSDHMTFIEKVYNTIYWLYARYKVYLELIPVHESIMRKHFGDAPPSIYEAQKNISLLMLGSNWLFGYPAPHVPALISYHGLHVKTTPDPLPQDLQKYLDEATDGVIYFSLGTNVFSNNLQEKQRRVFVDAFSELPQEVLWKWESDNLPGKPTNVKIAKWLPQQDVLAHPNVKLFITHCGLQSFQEAVHNAVPMLGIPFFGDQMYNARKIQETGMGLQLSFKEITKESLLKAIHEILHNTSFRDNVNKYSALSRDLPEPPMEKVIWWTEYVIRHKGAKHLKCAATDLEWYQYLLLDVIAFLIVLTLTAISILYYICKLIILYLVESFKCKAKSE